MIRLYNIVKITILPMPDKAMWSRVRKLLTEAAEAGGGNVSIHESDIVIFEAQFPTELQAATFESELRSSMGTEV